MRKIFSQKKWAITAIVLFLGLVCFAIYSLVSINQNVQKMTQVAAVTYFPEYPPIKSTGKDAATLKRGEYLVKAGDCIACHTNTGKNKGQPFAGGLPMPTPFGTIYSPNITPDKETGIGGWTDEQFIKAMREGIAPKGHYYYPAFPYLYFSKITLDDLKAIKAYLDNIPAVTQKNRDNEMMFPFNFRFLQLGWRILFFHPENTEIYQNDPKQSAQWNRGAYLTEGLGHCAMCHSPSYNLFNEALSLGAPIRKYDLTGAKIQGYLAPNITSSNLSKVSDTEVIEVFTQNKMIGGGKVEGPMEEVNEDSLKYMSQADLSAITTYLKSVQSKTPPLPKAGKGGFGKSVYESYCSGCHAMGGGGAPKYGDPGSWEAVLKQDPETTYTNAIKGIRGMPAKGTCLSCSDTQIQEAVDYMIASVKSDAGKAAVSTPKPKPLTLEDGKRIYQESCGVCHEVGFKHAPKPGDMNMWQPIIDAGFIPTYMNVMTGKNGHPPRGACEQCSDAEIKAAVKYMLQESSTTKDFSLW